MENKNDIDEELCEEGRILWQDIFDGCEYDVEKYNRYMDHIKSCEECRRKLGIDEVITEDELASLTSCGSTMTTEDKLEALALREKACAAAYAKGIKDASILALVAVVLTAVGVHVLF